MPYKLWGTSNQQKLYVFVENMSRLTTEKSSKSLHNLPCVKARNDWLISYTNGKQSGKCCDIFIH